MQIPHLFFGSFLIKIRKSQKKQSANFQCRSNSLIRVNISRKFPQKKAADFVSSAASTTFFL